MPPVQTLESQASIERLLPRQGELHVASQETMPTQAQEGSLQLSGSWPLFIGPSLDFQVPDTLLPCMVKRTTTQGLILKATKSPTAEPAGGLLGEEAVTLQKEPAH